MYEKLASSLTRCYAKLKKWHAAWHTDTPVWKIDTLFGTLACQVQTLARLRPIGTFIDILARKNEKLARWHAGNLAHKTTLARKHIGT